MIVLYLVLAASLQSFKTEAEAVTAAIAAKASAVYGVRCHVRQAQTKPGSCPSYSPGCAALFPPPTDIVVADPETCKLVELEVYRPAAPEKALRQKPAQSPASPGGK